jgi:hypothetical protein
LWKRFDVYPKPFEDRNLGGITLCVLGVAGIGSIGGMVVCGGVGAIIGAPIDCCCEV